MNEENQIDEIAPWVVIVITIVGGWIRLLYLGYKGMWLDETFSVWLANQSVGEMLQWIARIDQHPPLYYLLLHSWIARFGDSPYEARMISVLFSAATIPVIYQIGKRMSGVVMGLVAAILLAFSPFNIHYAQETRMYTLLTFNIAVAVLALVRLLTDSRASRPIGSQLREFPQVWRAARQVEPITESEFSYQDKASRQSGWRGWISRIQRNPLQAIETDLAWIALIVFSAAAMLTHNTAVLFLAAINIFVVGLMLFQRAKITESPSAFKAPSSGNWIKAQLGIFLLWSPWFIPFIKQVRRVDQEFWVPKPDWEIVTRTLRSLINDVTPGRESQIAIMWILYGLVLVFGLVHYRKNISRFAFLAVLFATPILGELLVSIRRPIFLDRTLIWTTIPLLLLLAAGVVQFRFRILMFVIVGLFLTNNLSSITDYHRYAQREDWNTAAGYIANFAQKDDLVLFNASWVQIPFDYYFENYEDQYGLEVEKRGVPVNMFDAGILEPKMTESDVPGLVSLISGRKRVFLVYSHNWYTDPQTLIPQTIEAKMKLVRKRDFFGGQVRWYEAP